jgi:Flp pilus assembly protein TadD
MSIIHDALKKAQEQRKKDPAGIPYSNQPEVKKKPRVALVAVVALLAAAVVVYLYVPAFHRQKASLASQAKPSPPAQTVAANVKPVQELDRKEYKTDEGPTAPTKTDTKENRSPAGKTAARKAEKAALPVPGAVQAASRSWQTGDVLRAAAPVSAKGSKGRGEYRRSVEEPAEEPIRRTPARKTEDERIDAQYNEALNAVKSGRSREAQRMFLAIVARRPDHVESLNNLGVISASLGNKKEALAYFKKILESRADYPKAYNNIGLIMMSEGDKVLAEEYFRKAISLDPQGLEPYINLSALLRTQGRFQDAANVLEEPIKRNTRDQLLLLSYAIIKDNMGQTAEATTYYRQYLALARPSDVRNGVIERLKYLEDRGKK